MVTVPRLGPGPPYAGGMRRARSLAPVVVVLLQVAVLVTLLLTPPRTAPQGSPVTLVGPPVVSTALVDRLNHRAGHPFDASAGTTAHAAEREVEDGVVLAAVVVDLSRERDVLYVDAANGERLNEALTREAGAVAASLGRTLDVVDVDPNPADRRIPYLVTAATLVLGFLVTLALNWRRRSAGPERGPSRTRHRLVAASLTVAVAAGAGAIVTDLTGVCGWVAIVVAATLTASTFTAALVRLVGVWGHGVAATLFLVTAAPLVRATHPLLLPGVWSDVTPWLPHGAVLDVTVHLTHFDGLGSPRSWALLLGYVLVSWLTLTLSDRAQLART